MRPLTIVLLAMGIGFSLHAQTGAPTGSTTAPSLAASPTSDSATAKVSEPTSTTAEDNTRYVNDPNLLKKCTARVAAIGDKACDIIFIGDSITEGWLGTGKAIWDSKYAPHHALNFGIDGDKTQNVLWRLSNMSIQSLKPKVAVVLIGTSNTMNTPHEIADGIKAVLANTEESFPGVKIVLVSLLPNERAEDKMMQVNSLIRGFADDQNIFFLNLVPLMPSTSAVDASGKISTTWKGLGADQLNLDASGYQIWADAMGPVLEKAMGGK